MGGWAAGWLGGWVSGREGENEVAGKIETSSLAAF